MPEDVFEELMKKTARGNEKRGRNRKAGNVNLNTAAGNYLNTAAGNSC